MVFCARISNTTLMCSIAIFGASERENSVGEVVFRNLLSAGFDGGIYSINPKRDTIQGQKAYRCIGDVDDTVDLAVVITPAPTIPAIVQECGENGVKMMIIISAGFREAGAEGRKIEDEVVRIAKDYGIRFIIESLMTPLSMRVPRQQSRASSSKRCTSQEMAENFSSASPTIRCLVP